MLLERSWWSGSDGQFHIVKAVDAKPATAILTSRDEC